MLESLAPETDQKEVWAEETDKELYFPHVPREVALPRCCPARPGTQPDEDGETLKCTGASLESRTRLCLPGKLLASEAASLDGWPGRSLAPEPRGPPAVSLALHWLPLHFGVPGLRRTCLL